MVRSASRPGEPEIIHNLNHSQKKLNPHKYLWVFHTEKQVGQISEYFPVEKFGLLWKVKIKQSWGRRDQSPAALGQSGGAFIKMANRPEIPDLYPFKSHLLALQPLSLLFRHEKITFTKMTLETSIMITFFATYDISKYEIVFRLSQVTCSLEPIISTWYSKTWVDPWNLHMLRQIIMQCS